MFAIFFHESMNAFHQTVTSFPTVVYTLLLILCALYWLVAVLGVVDIDILDIDTDFDATDSLDAQNALAGLLFKFGLNGAPLTIIVTIISIVGWLLCYYASFYTTKLLVIPTEILQLAVNIGIFIVATYFSVLVTAQIIKPIRKLFTKLDIDETKHILGQTVTVRSGEVNAQRGEAYMNDGGAGLILNVRTSNNEVFKKGDEVVVIEQLSENNLYRVIAKSEFVG